MTTEPERESWMAWVWRGLMALGIAALLLGGAWVWIRTRAIDRLESEMSRLQSEMESIKIEVSAHDKTAIDRFDSLERMLFGDVLELIKKQPSTVEVWQKNRDKELRDRIISLERWRREMEQP